MKIVTSSQMKSLDEATIASGISNQTLMKRAARAVYKEISVALSHRLNSKTALVWVGKGKNGGDGRLVAKMLKKRGATVVLSDAFQTTLSLLSAQTIPD